MNAFEVLVSGDTPSDRVAVIDPDDRHWLYQDLRTLVDHLAGFVEQCTQPQDRCLIHAENSMFWVCNFLGIIRAGRVAVPVPAGATPELLSKIIRDCAPSLAFADAQRLSSLLEQDCQGIHLIGEASEADGLIEWAEALAFVPIEQSYEPTDQTIAALIYSADPAAKPAVLNHDDLAASMRALAEAVSLSASDCATCMLPVLMKRLQTPSGPLHA